MIYMYNALIDVSDTTESTNGRFKEYNDKEQKGLQRSQVWLVQKDPNVPNPDPDKESDWTVEQPADGTQLQLAPADQVWMRVGGLTNGFSARMTTVVTRNASRAMPWQPNGKALQQRASPFPLNGTQRSCTMFDSGLLTPSPLGSCVQRLGLATLRTPPPPGKPATMRDSYHLILAATVGQGTRDSDLADVRTYAHDPECD